MVCFVKRAQSGGLGVTTRAPTDLNRCLTVVLVHTIGQYYFLYNTILDNTIPYHAMPYYYTILHHRGEGSAFHLTLYVPSTDDCNTTGTEVYL